nr:MAG TPA: V-type proton ATPase subunit [Bacteriophage sp.]
MQSFGTLFLRLERSPGCSGFCILLILFSCVFAPL